MIDEINVADDDLMLLEWKIAFDREDEKAWAYEPKSKKNRKGQLRSRLPENFQEIEPNDRMQMALTELFTTGSK